MEKIIIENGTVSAVSPEGKTATMPLEALLARVAPRRMDTLDVALPDGVKFAFSAGAVTILVHQIPPKIHHVMWIAPDSPSEYGPGAMYVARRISMPYLITFAVFNSIPGRRHELHLTGRNECFFRTEPLATAEDALCYPALLNCSRFRSQEGHPLSWICTEKLNRIKLGNERDNNHRVRAGMQALLHCLLETSFNRSSEHHEGSSWFTESTKADPRIATIEAWETATKEDPLFVLDVSWLKTRHSVRQVAERTFQNLQAVEPAATSATDLARIVFNHDGKDKPEDGEALKSLHFAFLHQLGI